MRSFLKMSAVSAVLSFTLVTAYHQAWSSQAEPLPGKKYQDRLSDLSANARPAAIAVPARAGRATGDRLSVAGACTEQTWPTLAPACLPAEPAAHKPARMITVETREGANTSVLTRVQQPAVASR